MPRSVTVVRIGRGGSPCLESPLGWHSTHARRTPEVDEAYGKPERSPQTAPLLRMGLMGREGLEPSTYGL